LRREDQQLGESPDLFAQQLPEVWGPIARAAMIMISGSTEQARESARRPSAAESRTACRRFSGLMQ